MKPKWKEIPKDEYGFFDDDSDLYEKLPIIVAEIDDGIIFCHYVNQDNWHDIVSDFSKESFKFYTEVEHINEEEQ